MQVMWVQAAGGAARGCAALTGDQEYSNRFRPQPMTQRQHLLHGVQSAGVGFYEGRHRHREGAPRRLAGGAQPCLRHRAVVVAHMWTILLTFGSSLLHIERAGYVHA